MPRMTAEKMNKLGIRLPPDMWTNQTEENPNGAWIHEVRFNYSCASGQELVMFMAYYFRHLHEHKLIDEDIVAKVKQTINETGGK